MNHFKIDLYKTFKKSLIFAGECTLKKTFRVSLLIILDKILGFFHYIRYSDN